MSFYFTNKQRHECVCSDMLVAAVEEHVGDESPGLDPFPRVVDEVGAEEPLVERDKWVGAQTEAGWGVHTDEIKDHLK